MYWCNFSFLVTKLSVSRPKPLVDTSQKNDISKNVSYINITTVIIRVNNYKFYHL